MARYSILFFALIYCSTVQAQLSVPSSTAVEKEFRNLPDSVRPSVYWYWMSDNISVEGVKKDLEAMAAVGIGRAFIGNIGLSKGEMQYGPVKLFSDEWWKVTRAAISTATKKNIEIGLFNSPGWSQSGGPWINPAQSMRYLAGEEMTVTGPTRFSKKLIPSQKNFQHVAVIAFPAIKQTTEVFAISADVPFPGIENLVDGKTSTNAVTPDGKALPAVVNIDLVAGSAITIRSVVIHPGTWGFRANIIVQVKKDGTYHDLKTFEYDRTNGAANVGFMTNAPVAISLPVTAGNEFRLRLSGMDGRPAFSEIKLSGAELLERYEEKQLAKMFQTPLPLWNEYQWALQREPADQSLLVSKGGVIDLQPMMSKDSLLTWEVPAGEWTIVHYGMLPTGVTNAPASPEGQGLEIDKINNLPMQHHFDSFVGKIRKNIPLAERTSLRWVVADSYETGSQNWTDGMLGVFKKRYNYNPLPWLPVLSGRIVGSADQSDRFLWDLRRLVADRVAEQYVGGLRKISHKNGMKVWLENYGHWGFPSEFLKYGGQSDEIAGEFWNEGTLGNIECRAASSAAHIYGKTRVAAESFTSGGAAYARYPALLKKRGDWSFTEGINHSLLHVFISQPYEERNTGVNTWFGTEFNRKNSWFYQGKAFFDYLRRCNYILQQGLPVNDVAYFIGEDAPKMTGIRNPELPAGFSYDYINEEVLMTRASVKNGRMVLPDGMSYRLLVLPQLETMRPELLVKISQMVKAGLVVTGPPPKRSPSMENYPDADKQIAGIVQQTWGTTPEKIHQSGIGILFNGVSMDSLFHIIALPPDFISTQENVLYAHRTTKQAEYYFISNQSDSLVRFDARFRVSGRQPEWWDAVDGSARMLENFTSGNGITTIPLQLEAQQSAFIVFRKPLTGALAKTVIKNKQTDTPGPLVATTSFSANHTNFPASSTVLAVKGPWTVHFDTALRGPAAAVIMDTLVDWKDSPDPAIQNYSGTAIYRNSIDVPVTPAKAHVYLHTSKVGVMAVVRINGKNAGSVWTSPYRVDITPLLKKGRNSIEIEVVNTWVNRLIGDSKLPESERKTWLNVNNYNPQSQYQSSGLVGPVTLETFIY